MPKFKKKTYSYLAHLIILGFIGLCLSFVIRLFINVYNADVTYETNIEQSINRNPQADILLTQGLEYVAIGHQIDAEKTFKKAIEIDANLAEAYNNLAVIYYGRSQIEKAIYFFEKSIAINPNYHVAFYNLSWLLWHHMYFRDWEKIVQRQVDYRKNNSPAEYSLALIASVLNDYNIAYITKEFRSTIEKTQPDAKAYFDLGLALEIQGNYKDSISQYRKAINLKLNSPQVHYRLGNIFKNLDKKRKAIFHLNQAKEIYIKQKNIYIVWSINRLIAQIKGDTELSNLVNFDSSKLLKTDFVEDRKKLSADEIYDLVSPAVPCIIPKAKSQNSESKLTLFPMQYSGCKAGINLTADGFILTNAHTIDDSDQVSVIFKNNERYTGIVLDRDSDFDLALIKINQAEDLPTVTWATGKKEYLNKSDIRLVDYDVVYAIGFPERQPWQMNQGNIQKMRIEGDFRKPKKSIFTTSTNFIHPGFSGGPLINPYGQIIGVNFAIIEITGQGQHLSVTMVKDFIDRVIPANRIKELGL